MRTAPISIPILAAGLLFICSTSRAESTQTTTVETKKHVKSEEHVEARQDRDGAKAPLAADNTGVNKRDHELQKPTADQQKNDKSDVEITAEIRRAIIKEKSLSVNAHNVKIIVENGHVTLKGPVASKEEKALVEKKATEVVGAGKRTLTSEVTVAP